MINYRADMVPAGIFAMGAITKCDNGGWPQLRSFKRGLWESIIAATLSLWCNRISNTSRRACRCFALRW